MNATVPSEAQLRKANEHTIYIRTRYGETTRECFCLTTEGRTHHENQFPWVVDTKGELDRSGRNNEKRREVVDPDREPYRSGEDVEDYLERLRLAENWDEAFSQGYAAANQDRNEPVTDDQVKAALASFAKNPHRGAA